MKTYCFISKCFSGIRPTESMTYIKTYCLDFAKKMAERMCTENESVLVDIWEI